MISLLENVCVGTVTMPRKSVPTFTRGSTNFKNTHHALTYGDRASILYSIVRKWK